MVCWGLLRKNLLLPCWGYFRCTWSTGDTLGKNLLLLHWRFLKYAWVHWGRIFCLLHGDDVWCIWSIGEESSASLLGMMFDVFNPLRKNLLLPYLGWNLMCLIHWEESSTSLVGMVFLIFYDLLGMVLGCTCFIRGKSLLLPLLLTRESFIDFVFNWDDYEIFFFFFLNDGNFFIFYYSWLNYT